MSHILDKRVLLALGLINTVMVLVIRVLDLKIMLGL